MSKTIIVSNRLPLQIKICDNDIRVSPSAGGLATGLKSVHKSGDSCWIGWTGLNKEELTDDLRPKIKEALDKEKCVGVELSEYEVNDFYFGFCNRTIWPLFHYFTEYTKYKKRFWQAYVDVNMKFADAVIKELKPGDKVWVHDYQLLLLPKMIKERAPDVSIGFFLHIPFPSFEVFRILPWREAILEGMLGADLLGFHTYNYQRHFISSVRRLMGHEVNFNEINLDNRIVKVEIFPMGIDYNRFNETALKQKDKYKVGKSKIHEDIDRYLWVSPDVKLVLSVDRLDYTKGITNRLMAYEYFLEKYPEYREKVTLIMLAVPSRANVYQYQLMKSEVDEHVGRINGKYATINWSPIWYFYRSIPFEDLVDLYSSCGIAMVTPVRDGMNLVAKEYVASRVDKKGVLILSEMAGASYEMSEALLVNPNNFEEISDALKKAISMDEKEQTARIKVMQHRLKRYNVYKWANDFITSLSNVKLIQEKYNAKRINQDIEDDIIKRYKLADKRVIFLDYDGTLVGFKNRPELAIPDKELYELLDKLASDTKNEVVIISGRDCKTFSNWFKDKKYTLITEHGVWIRKPGNDWELIEQMNNDWKEKLNSVIEFYVDVTPGSFVEEKNFSLVWHFRKVDPDLGALRAKELKEELTDFVANHNLEIMEGNKVIEVKNAGVNKGKAANKRLGEGEDFIIGIGDDWTDEFLFEELPESAVTIKVGQRNTHAKYNLDNYQNVRELLEKLTKV